MIDEIQNLSEEERNELLLAVPRITVLIAGADGTIDEDETEWAEKIMKIRSYASIEALRPFYTEVGINFNNVLHSMIESLPREKDERKEILSNQLNGLNDILPKLSPRYGADLYKSFVTFAEHVAKASGGFLRFFSVSAEEKKLLSLPMIAPIEYVDEEE